MDADAELIAKVVSGRVWDELCDAMQEAGRIIRARAPDTDLDRAEGHRYLTRLARMAFKLCIEHADPGAPALVEYMDATQKFGVDNPDQLYQWARISGKYAYRLAGPRGTATYVGIGVYAGSAGRGGRRTVAHVQADDLTVGADGRLDVVLSAGPRPVARDTPGTRPHPEGPLEEAAPAIGATALPSDWIELAPDTTTLLVRQTMNDRATEVPAALTLTRLDAAGPPPPLDPARLAQGLARAARQILGSARMFADLSDQWAAQPNYLHPSDARMARESFGDPDLYYMGGYWRLAPDEALVLEFVPPACRYWSFLLCNYWTESLEYRYRPVWTNKRRATYRPDGSVQIVVAAADPGIPGATWLDTEGHREGTMTLRWLLAETTPVPAPRVVKLPPGRADRAR